MAWVGFVGGAWIRGWRKSNFDKGCVARVGLYSFEVGQNNGRGSNFGTLLKLMPNHLHQSKQLNFNPHFCLTKHINQ